LNHALGHAEGRYFAKFDDDDYYGPDYLSDSMLAFEFSKAAVVGKMSYFAYVEGLNVTALRFPGREHRYSSFVSGATLVVDRSATHGIDFAPVRSGTDSLFLEACTAKGLAIYSSDRFNFMAMRQSAADRHTWKIDDRSFLRKCRIVGNGRRLELANL
jgi:hypothetical protein